ncbi:MAG: hypothetical protein OM95_13635 [Bdellovibrio sp. ArHS]|uniref:hypothetical protein n=1 Tax=Bdellovibrio sp. ArHS TaxID=1569284 RepID=UPI000582C297|nr:hypothetical protein [Bdellovibrio sp. ArHS]KHD87623.1 MAG: hypothetical protein OM95_13635 [Bdellovibrio sp. ArHS]
MFQKLFFTSMIVGGSLSFLALFGPHIEPAIRSNVTAQKILIWLNSPFQSQKVNAEDLDQMRRNPLQAQRGTQPSPSKKVWELTLNKTTESELAEWIRAKKIACSKSSKGYNYIKCQKVPLKALGLPYNNSFAELDFTIDAQNRLIFVGLLHRQLPTDKALSLLENISDSLKSRLGAPTRSPASVTSAELEHSLEALSYEYKFKDYIARVTASKLSTTGIILYEQHIYIP